MTNDVLKVSYSVLFVALVLSLYGALKSDGFLEDILISLFTTIIGIFVTVILIDRAIEEDAERKRHKILRIAFKYLPIRSQFSLFMTMGRANAPNGAIANYSNLYEVSYHIYLKKLDLSAKGPGRWNNGKDMTWGEYISLKCNEFKDSIDSIMGKYILYLNDEEITLLQSILDSKFLNFSTRTIPLFLTSKEKLVDYHLFDANGMYEETEEYLNMLRQLLDIFNIYCLQEDIVPFD
jgi:hypothetical protein